MFDTVWSVDHGKTLINDGDGGGNVHEGLLTAQSVTVDAVRTLMSVCLLQFIEE